MRRHPKRAEVNPESPRAWATSDRNGMISNHEKMQWQWDWAGTQLINKRILVSVDELDTPQEQLRTIILPIDPPPIMNARPESYFIDEETRRRESDGTIRYQMDGTIRILSNAQSGSSS